MHLLALLATAQAVPLQLTQQGVFLVAPLGIAGYASACLGGMLHSTNGSK